MEDKKISIERSLEAAKPVREISDKALELDVNYLETALISFRESFNRKMSMAVLDPQPTTFEARMDLEGAKIRQLELMIELGKNAQNIYGLTLKLSSAVSRSEELCKVFGI